jgi:small subunit ribosomal protein S3
MGRKVHPVGFRLGINKEWQSRWYADRNYTELVQEDARIRQTIQQRLSGASLARIEIQRSANQIEVSLHTAKPGVVIGKGGQAVDQLRKDLETMTGKKVKLNIEEIKQPELNAYLVAESIAEQITRRVSYRRAVKQSVLRAMRSGAKGVRVRVSGRLGGAEMARSVWEREGRVPLHTIRADIDYGQVHAHTTYGRIGVKVWIYRGDVIERKGDSLLQMDRPAAMAQPRPERDRRDRGPVRPERADRGERADRSDRGDGAGPRPLARAPRPEGARPEARGPRPEQPVQAAAPQVEAPQVEAPQATAPQAEAPRAEAAPIEQPTPFVPTPTEAPAPEANATAEPGATPETETNGGAE